jgi:hypothetical protein
LGEWQIDADMPASMAARLHAATQPGTVHGRRGRRNPAAFPAGLVTRCRRQRSGFIPPLAAVLPSRILGILAGMERAPAVPTLEQLRRGTPWCWVVCEQCFHRRPVAFVPLIIRWGPDASSDMLRWSARCTKCGRKGAVLRYRRPIKPHVQCINEAQLKARKGDPNIDLLNALAADYVVFAEVTRGQYTLAESKAMSEYTSRALHSTAVEISTATHVQTLPPP